MLGIADYNSFQPEAQGLFIPVQGSCLRRELSLSDSGTGDDPAFIILALTHPRKLL